LLRRRRRASRRAARKSKRAARKSKRRSSKSKRRSSKRRKSKYGQPRRNYFGAFGGGRASTLLGMEGPYMSM
jgi:hypothetical protein